MPRACPPEALDRPWSGTTCKAAARVARASLALQVSRRGAGPPLIPALIGLRRTRSETSVS